ncbi:hypothetical protein [Sphingomonas sp. MA1305]|uniref:hypothetical protein n=1 Tax=Sphingomonas sp. MA1305 TaxID=2479204 RepID=UPI003FA70EF2
MRVVTTVVPFGRSRTVVTSRRCCGAASAAVAASGPAISVAAMAERMIFFMMSYSHYELAPSSGVE